MISMTAWAAEEQFKDSVRKNYKLVRIPMRTILIACKFVPMRRREKVVTCLREEYGRLDRVPETEWIDRLFGLDCVVQVGDELVGVDVTCDPTQVDYKYQKLYQLREAHRALGIYRTVVYCAELHSLDELLR